ncbi:alpha-galactosidase [Alkalibacterium sp. 20]|uniref:alpha-galactosidase n=1 Tax=Alkalibacterium sp. 20 TaxID=1798803 RepID=UPI0009003665|nr:alpha-galactosidase [Alkalibacterium sp. 20]OJF92772.1 alpha-galactosidase [Alkalibacterium sp. 20]
MNIFYNEKTKSFHMKNDIVSYQFSIEQEKYLTHNYWGKAVSDNQSQSDYRYADRPFSVIPNEFKGREFSLTTLPQEFPGDNNGDYRESALTIRYKDGSFNTALEYASFEIIDGKPGINGLPATYINKDSEAKTLKITLVDTIKKLEVNLFYTIFEKYGVITRSAEIINKNIEVIEIEKMLSASVDFDHSNFDFIQLPGAWGREREIERDKLSRGVHKLDSKRGTTSHTYQPFIALTDPDTTEHSGEVYGMHFVYSGEFVANVEVDEYRKTRLQMGINPEHFSWKLNKGEIFQTPEVVMVYSDQGLNKMSQDLHQLYQNNLIRGEHQNEERPVLINNWEGTYFDFTEDKIENMAEEAASLGIELFVLDDGWFGKRDDDLTSLGDWFEYKDKLPNGLKALAEKIKSKGLKFGLWFELEMISEDSDLYRDHPEWVLKAKDSVPSQVRDQFVIDYSQKEARDHVLKQMKKILDDVPIDYIKWDYNRNMSELGSQNPSIKDGEVAHRFILGLYEMLENLTSTYPNILWESCSGGGGRYDPGMLHYMPQTWTSDNTDAVARLEIQTGTSMTMPISSMGSHVSAVPNHQVSRMTSLKMRGDVAMAGNLGYELDVTEMNDDDKETVKRQIEFYKENRSLIQFGTFYRIISPFDSKDSTSWMIVNQAKDEALMYFYKILDRANTLSTRVKFKGLQPEFLYQVNKSESCYYGDELMNKGIYIDPVVPVQGMAEPQPIGDFRSEIIKISKVTND